MLKYLFFLEAFEQKYNGESNYLEFIILNFKYFSKLEHEES